MNQNKSFGIIILIVIVIFLGLLFGYTQYKRSFEAKEYQTALRKTQALAASNTVLKGEIDALNRQLDNLYGADINAEKLQAALGSLNLPADQQMAAFFLYLDNQPYVQKYTTRANAKKLKVQDYAEVSARAYLSVLDIFKQDIALLAKEYPKVVGETKTLFGVMRNFAYFYRTLGSTQAELLLEIIDNEHDIIEPVMAAFYNWALMENPSLTGAPDLKFMYEYSNYFLNSIGGRAYLERRPNKLSLLALYYCILTIDRAADNGENYYGIDLRPYIDKALNGLKTQTGLLHRSDYLAKLDELRVKHQR